MAEKNGGYKLETPGKMEIIRRITERLQSYLSSLQQDNGCRPRRFDLFEVAE